MAFNKDFSEREIKELDAIKKGYRTRVIEPAQGGKVLDIREFLESAKYTGPTKRGIRLTKEEIQRAIEVFSSALEVM